MMTRITFIAPDCGGRHCLPEGDGYSPDLHLRANGNVIPVRFVGTPSNIHYSQEYVQILDTWHRPESEWLQVSGTQPGDEFDLRDGAKLVATGVYVQANQQADPADAAARRH